MTTALNRRSDRISTRAADTTADRIAGQHGPRFVCMRERHLEPDALDHEGVREIEPHDIDVMQTRRDALSFEKTGRD
jgi:hypothetical protein